MMAVISHGNNSNIFAAFFAIWALGRNAASRHNLTSIVHKVARLHSKGG
jgi:hypothetical protein